MDRYTVNNMCVCTLRVESVEQQRELSTQTQNKTDSVRITIKLGCGYVNIFDMEKQDVVHILRGYI